jgi:hypothetical protein
MTVRARLDKITQTMESREGKYPPSVMVIHFKKDRRLYLDGKEISEHEAHALSTLSVKCKVEYDFSDLTTEELRNWYADNEWWKRHDHELQTHKK